MNHTRFPQVNPSRSGDSPPMLPALSPLVHQEGATNRQAACDRLAQCVL